jgi:hypothetical protein
MYRPTAAGDADEHAGRWDPPPHDALDDRRQDDVEPVMNADADGDVVWR